MKKILFLLLIGAISAVPVLAQDAPPEIIGSTKSKEKGSGQKTMIISVIYKYKEYEYYVDGGLIYHDRTLTQGKDGEKGFEFGPLGAKIKENNSPAFLISGFIREGYQVVSQAYAEKAPGSAYPMMQYTLVLKE